MFPPLRAMEGAVRKYTPFLDTQPPIGSNRHPQHGSTLLMLSQTGACSLLFRMPVVQEPAATEAYDRARDAGIQWPQLWNAGHIDLKLIQSLRHDAGEHMQACYFCRPLHGAPERPLNGAPARRPGTRRGPAAHPSC